MSPRYNGFLSFMWFVNLAYSRPCLNERSWFVCNRWKDFFLPLYSFLCLLLITSFHTQSSVPVFCQCCGKCRLLLGQTETSLAFPTSKRLNHFCRAAAVPVLPAGCTPEWIARLPLYSGRDRNGWRRAQFTDKQHSELALIRFSFRLHLLYPICSFTAWFLKWRPWHWTEMFCDFCLGFSGKLSHLCVCRRHSCVTALHRLHQSSVIWQQFLMLFFLLIKDWCIALFIHL